MPRLRHDCVISNDVANGARKGRWYSHEGFHSKKWRCRVSGNCCKAGIKAVKNNILTADLIPYGARDNTKVWLERTANEERKVIIFGSETNEFDGTT